MRGNGHRAGCACNFCRETDRVPTKRRAPADRFWPKVDTSGDCWLWTGAIGKSGYGNFWDGGRYIHAHQFAWELAKGPVPAGQELCHTCDRRPCVRPDHLFLGTHHENIRDAVEKGRMRNGLRDRAACAHGHPFTPENTRVRRDGARICLTCSKHNAEQSYARKKARRQAGAA